MAFKNLYEEDSLSYYVSEIRKFPMLEQDEEYTLAKKWKEDGDKSALRKIISSHLRLVMKIARGYSGYGLPQADLIAEGNIGIMQALQHFDPSIGYRFSTYAAWWIKSKIKDFIYNSWSIVKLSSTKNYRKAFFGLRKTKNMLGLDTLSDENADIVANKLNVSKEEVLTLENRFTLKDFSSNIQVEKESTSTFQDFLVDTKSSPEETTLEKQEFTYRKKMLHDALNTLSPRERYIVCEYRLQNPTKTLREIAKKISISAERVRQIEGKAFLKIQKYVQSIECNPPSQKSDRTYKKLSMLFSFVAT